MSNTIAFDSAFYASQNPDVAFAISRGQFTSYQQHYEQFGRFEGRNPNAFFNTAFYLQTYQDVARAGVNPLTHFLTSGAAEGRFANATERAAIDLNGNGGADDFNNAKYLSDYSDVRDAVAAGTFKNAYQHFVQFGQFEGRIGTLANGTTVTGPFTNTGAAVNAGSTFTLTTGADGAGAASPAANLTATNNADTFNALIDANTAANSTLTLVDTINGLGGTDVLNLRTVGAATLNAGNVPTLTSIETINVTALSGATSLNLVVAPAATSVGSANSNNSVTFTNANVGAAVSVSGIAGNDADVSVTYKTGLSGTTDAVALSVNGNSAADTTVAANFAGVTLAGAAAGEGVDIVNLSSTGAASRLDFLTVTDSAAASTLATLNVTGNQNLQINNALDFVGTAGTLNASTFTGNLNVTFGAEDVNVTGGTGNDRFNFAGTLTSADKVNGGEGTDIVAISDNIVANSAGTATDATKALVTAINGLTSIEVLELTQANAQVSASSDLTTINTFAFSNATAGAIVVTNVENNDTFQLNSDGTSAGFTAKLDNGSNVLNLTTRGADFTGDVGGANFETINLAVTNGTNADDTTFGTLTTNTNGKVVITGAGDVGFTVVGTNATIDASALTGKLTVVGEAGNNTIIGGSGNDIITGGAGQDSIDLSKGGTDIIRLGLVSADRDTVTGFAAGVGGDIIDVQTQTFTLAAGATDQIGTAQYKDFTGTAGAFTFAAANLVQEFSFNATNNGANLANATDGTELLKAIANQGSTITSVTVAANAVGEIVAYQNGNAYIFHYDSADTSLVASEIQLVGTLTGVAVGALTDANFA